MQSCSTFLIEYLKVYATRVEMLTLTHSIICMAQLFVCLFYYFKLPSLRLSSIAFEDRKRTKQDSKMHARHIKRRKDIELSESRRTNNAELSYITDNKMNDPPRDVSIYDLSTERQMITQVATARN